MLIINESKEPKALVFWLHGLGADCFNFEPIVKAINLKDFEFILPNAPVIPITLNGGNLMRGWYDIKSLEFKHNDDIGLKKSKVFIENIIKERIKSKKTNPKIFIIGFSQGGALALYLSEFSEQKFTAAISLSGYLPMYNKEIKERSSVYAMHGTYDEVIDIKLAKKSYFKLIQSQSLQFYEFSMGHEVIEEEIALIRKIFISELNNG